MRLEGVPDRLEDFRVEIRWWFDEKVISVLSSTEEPLSGKEIITLLTGVVDLVARSGVCKEPQPPKLRVILGGRRDNQCP